MTTSPAQHRVSAGIPTGGQFAGIAHAEPTVTLPVGQDQLYELSRDAESGRDAAREAVRTHEAVLESPLHEGELQLVEEEAADDAKLRVALDSLGPLDDVEQQHFGELLAQELLEHASRREESRWATAYTVERHLDRAPVEQESAYELNDPKHPGYQAGLLVG